MVKPVDRIVPDFTKAGANLITFTRRPPTTWTTLGLIKEQGCRGRSGAEPATPLTCLEYVMDKLDVILLMSVNPGFGGQSFIPGTSTSGVRCVA